MRNIILIFFVALGSLAAQQDGVIVRGQQATNTLFTRAGGLVTWRCGTGMTCSWANGIFTMTSAAGGDVIGPAGATDNAVARYDTATGKLLQNSVVTIDDSGNVSTAGTVTSGAGGAVSGAVHLGQGTEPTPAANSVMIAAPTSVGTAYKLILPSAIAAGFVKTTAGGTVSFSSVTHTFGCVFDGGGSTVVDNSICYTRLPVAGTIVGWSVVAVGTSPACTADVFKIASGTALPTASIAGSALPALTGTDNAIKSTTLTGWTTTITAEDIAAVKITEPGAATWVEVLIYYTES